jgi:hypothetical protein
MATLVSSAYSTMLGVVRATSNKYYITFSGSKFTGDGPALFSALESATHEVFGGQKKAYELVRAGKIGQIIDNDGPSLMEGTYQNFAGMRIDKQIRDQSSDVEVINAPPGTCALPILVEHCRAMGDPPEYVCEVRFDPNDRSPVNVFGGDVDGNHDILSRCGHLHPTPSCPNCRKLVELQLGGARERSAELRKRSLLESGRLAAEKEWAIAQRRQAELWAQEEEEDKKRRAEDKAFVNKMQKEMDRVRGNQEEGVAIQMLVDAGVIASVVRILKKKRPKPDAVIAALKVHYAPLTVTKAVNIISKLSGDIADEIKDYI